MGVLSEGLRAHLSEEAIALLNGTRVGIAGAGGLGSNVAMLLVRSGVGSLVIVDGDTVASSNLNRQFFFPEDVGRPKVLALKERLLVLEPELDVTTRECWLDRSNTAGIFDGCRVVVEAVDSAETKAMLVHVLLEQGFFVVSASGLGGWGGAPMTRKTLPGRLVAVGDFSSSVAQGVPPMGPRVMQAAALQADAVLAHVLDPCTGGL